MPGFTLIYQHNGLDEGISKRTERLVDSSFKLQFISKTENMFLLFRDGNHYPYEIIETDEEIIIVAIMNNKVKSRIVFTPGM
jgi:hypothetical protein